ncbi:hypothetical protein [Kutzneria buriramensis]|uniref:Uncharacterized protein n=1 Tax=Kutzneria buriramensis TaxID=1045776 RepID=A0A3E0GWJ5_9PSEU|nr:hypothetical protein [Kutzneria buriramensis]REH31055.1 hypothetical protein BCF44_12278 [Kutzneria buriramensis]
MTAFVRPTEELFTRLKAEAGEVLPQTRQRPRVEFWPDWDHIASPAASTEAVVAALTLSAVDVPERAWALVVRTHCPRAHKALAALGLPIESVLYGQAPADVVATIATLVNAELGGFEVLTALDVPAMTAEVIAILGGVPRFDDRRS